MTILDFFNIPKQGQEFLLNPKGKSKEITTEIVDKIFISPIMMLGALSIASGGMYLYTHRSFLLLPFFIFTLPLAIFIAIYIFARVLVKKVIDRTSDFAAKKFSGFESKFSNSSRMKSEVIDVEAKEINE